MSDFDILELPFVSHEPEGTTENYRDLPAVAENVDEPERYSQTFLAHVDNCPRAGYLYLKHGRHGPTSHAMDRGTAFHLFAKEAIETLIESGEPIMPEELAKAIANGIVEERTDLTFPTEDKDDVRIMAFHWAKGTHLPPSRIAAVEKELELDVAGVKVRGTVDLVMLYPEQGHAEIWDWKTSFAIPNQRAFERSFQTRFYALLFAEGKGDDDPVGMGRGINTFRLVQAYPRFLRKEGLALREVTLDRTELQDFKHDVEATIGRAKRGFAEGKWQAVTSSHCSICPAWHECPLPPILIPGPINVEDDPVAAVERRYHLAELNKRVQRDLREYSKEHGAIEYGPVEPGKPGRIFGPVTRDTTKMKDRPLDGVTLKGKEALQYALDEAEVNGTPFNLDEHFKTSTSVSYTDRKHEPDDQEVEWSDE